MLEQLELIAEIGPGAANAAIAYFVAKGSVHLIWAAVVGTAFFKIVNTVSGQSELQDDVDRLEEESKLAYKGRDTLRTQMEEWKVACDRLDTELKNAKKEVSELQVRSGVGSCKAAK